MRWLPLPAGAGMGWAGAGPDLGRDGETPDALNPGKDGEMPSPPDEPDAVGSGAAGFGSAGVGKLGVICICASIIVEVWAPSFIGKLSDRQGDGPARIEAYPDG